MKSLSSLPLSQVGGKGQWKQNKKINIHNFFEKVDKSKNQTRIYQLKEQLCLSREGRGEPRKGTVQISTDLENQ